MYISESNPSKDELSRVINRMKSAKTSYERLRAKDMADNWLQHHSEERDIRFWLAYEDLLRDIR